MRDAHEEGFGTASFDAEISLVIFHTDIYSVAKLAEINETCTKGTLK